MRPQGAKRFHALHSDSAWNAHFNIQRRLAEGAAGGPGAPREEQEEPRVGGGKVRAQVTQLGGGRQDQDDVTTKEQEINAVTTLADAVTIPADAEKKLELLRTP